MLDRELFLTNSIFSLSSEKFMFSLLLGLVSKDVLFLCYNSMNAEGIDFLLLLIAYMVILKGGKKYQIKGCAGQGGFGTVFKAYVNSNPDEVVAIKVLLSFYSLPPMHSWTFLAGFRFISKILADTKACFPLGVLHVSPAWPSHLRQGSMLFSWCFHCLSRHAL